MLKGALYVLNIYAHEIKKYIYIYSVPFLKRERKNIIVPWQLPKNEKLL